MIVSSSTEAGIMAEIHKLSVEKTLNKIRGDDAKQNKRSHLIALRQTKISADEPASTWWPGERD